MGSKRPQRGEASERSAVAAGAFGHGSVRGAYEALGAAQFYALQGACYVNPHEEVLAQAFKVHGERRSLVITSSIQL